MPFAGHRTSYGTLLIAKYIGGLSSCEMKRAHYNNFLIGVGRDIEPPQLEKY